MNFDSDAFRRLWTWWNRAEGIAPWTEHNQGLISVVALAVALAAAVFEYRRALRAEAQARQAADTAKIEAAAEAVRAEIAQKLSTIHEFAIAARGVLLDVENDLQKDREQFKAYLFDTMAMPAPADWVRQGARASADTLNALLAATPLSPGLIAHSSDRGHAFHAMVGAYST